MRINAKLDEKSEQDLQFIQQTTGETVTQLIKEMLAERAARFRETNQPGAKLKEFLDSDFIGCGEGLADGSVNYKKYIPEYLDEKFGPR